MNEITGFFISFDNKEMADIKRRLDLFGYKEDGEGLKKLIMDSLCDMEEDEGEETPTDRVINKMNNFIENNPDKVLMGFAALKGLAKMIKKK